MSSDARKFAPAVARNREPIFEVLRPLLPKRGLVLEIASGSGEHITGLAEESVSDVVFQPSDPDADARRSIDAWTRELGLANVQPALLLDAALEDWPVDRANLVFCINMIHISPWQATEGLFRGAAGVLSLDGVLFTYGPYRRGGVHTSAGNEAFDMDLKRSNPAWGIRDVETVSDLAVNCGFLAPEIVEMPANNFSLVFRRK